MENRTIGVKIKWKLLRNNRVRTTFLMCSNYEDAMDQLITIKGGFDVIDIISIWDYDRETMSYVGDEILGSDTESIIYQYKIKWLEENSKTNE